MKNFYRVLFLQIILRSVAVAAGPIYQHENSDIQREFINVYQELRSVATSTSSGSSTVITSSGGVTVYPATATINAPLGIQVSTITVSTVNVSGRIVFGDGTILRSTATKYVQSDSNGVPRNFPASGVYENGTQILLSSGTWAINAAMEGRRENASWQTVELGVSISSGNTGSGLRLGQTRALENWNIALSTMTEFLSLSIPPFRAELTSPTTYYIKAMSVYTAGQPRYEYSISAWEVK